MLFDQLATKSYDAQAAAQWTKDIADIIEEKIKGDNRLSYVYVHLEIISYNLLQYYILNVYHIFVGYVYRSTI